MCLHAVAHCNDCTILAIFVAVIAMTLYLEDIIEQYYRWFMHDSLCVDSIYGSFNGNIYKIRFAKI